MTNLFVEKPISNILGETPKRFTQRVLIDGEAIRLMPPIARTGGGHGQEG